MKERLNRVPELQSRLKSHRAHTVVGCIATLVAVVSLLWLTSAFAQFALESYTATVIPAEGYSGGSARVTIQISSWTTDAEKQKLMDALENGTPDAAVALLHSMNHGHINIEGQTGRDIAAAFSRKVADGRKLTLILEHVLTLYEQNKGIKASDYPYTIVRMKFDPLGKPLSGEVIPAAKIKATKDGLLDVETESRNSGTIIDIKRVD